MELRCICVGLLLRMERTPALSGVGQSKASDLCALLCRTRSAVPYLLPRRFKTYLSTNPNESCGVAEGSVGASFPRSEDVFATFSREDACTASAESLVPDLPPSLSELAPSLETLEPLHRHDEGPTWSRDGCFVK